MDLRHKFIETGWLSHREQKLFNFDIKEALEFKTMLECK